MTIIKSFVYRFLLVTLCLSVIFTTHITGQKRPLKGVVPQEINFIENSWELAAKKARVEHKYIFVDLYAVWCGPCKVLKRTTFKDKKVAAFFNQNFINLSVDAERGKGIKLAEQWQVEAYPTLLMVDENGKIVDAIVGAVNAGDLLEFGKRIIAGKKNSGLL